VLSLFTKVPIVDSIELLSHHFEGDVLALFKHVLTSIYFWFDGLLYEQTDGVAMGSPLSPAIANFFVENFEKKAIEQAAHQPVCWFRCVDDPSVILPYGQEELTISEPSQWTPQEGTVYNGKKKKKATFYSWTLTSTEKRTAL